MATTIKFRRFFSIDDAKAVKAQKFGWLDAINYMAPHTTAGVGNLCPKADAECMELCLGTESGQAAMRKEGQDNSVTLSRKRKAQYFMRERRAFLQESAIHIAKAQRRAVKAGVGLAVRMNGATDVAWEGCYVEIDDALSAELTAILGRDVPCGRFTLMALFPDIAFIDYTKIASRFDRKLPTNYHLTFSRTSKNESVALSLLERGHNVACVFETVPATWNGFPVVDGDIHDLRHLDPKGVVVGLTPKGNKAKKSTNGFVIRSAGMMES